jgi:aminopeptidase N
MLGYDEKTGKIDFKNEINELIYIGIYDLELTQMSFCHGHEEETKSLEKKISCHCIKKNDRKRDLNYSHSNNNNENWIIPITILTNQSDGSSNKFLMTNKQEIQHINTNLSLITDEHDDNNEPLIKKRRYSSNWLKLNICSGGPYRVLYSSDMLEQLIQAINKQELSIFDRFNIENDMYALAMGGFTSLMDYLRLLLNAYMNEIDDELVWKDIESNIIRIGTLLEYDRQLFDYYRKFVVFFHRNLYQTIGFTSKNNNHEESIARGRLRCFLLVILGKI